jgi:hypothetical protein
MDIKEMNLEKKRESWELGFEDFEQGNYIFSKRLFGQPWVE